MYISICIRKTFIRVKEAIICGEVCVYTPANYSHEKLLLVLAFVKKCGLSKQKRECNLMTKCRPNGTLPPDMYKHNFNLATPWCTLVCLEPGTHNKC